MEAVIRKKNKIKPDTICAVTEYMIAAYMSAATIINLLNIADKMHFYTYFMKPTFFGSSMLIALLLQYSLIRENKKNQILVKIRPYVMGILAADIISVCNFPLCLMLMLIVGYFLLSGFQRKYGACEAALTVLVFCIGIEVYSIAMLLAGNSVDNSIGVFLKSVMPDVFFVVSTITYCITIRNREETDEEGITDLEVIPQNEDIVTENDIQIRENRKGKKAKRRKKYSVLLKLLSKMQVNSKRIAFYAGSVLCVLSLGLFIYYIVIIGIGFQKISGSTEGVYLLEHCDDASLVLTVVQEQDQDTYRVAFEKYAGTNNQKVYLRETWEGIYQIVFLEPECALEVNEQWALYAAPVTDSPNQTWYMQMHEGEEGVYRLSCAYGLPLCYSALSPDNETISVVIGNIEGGHDLFKRERTVSDGFITRFVVEHSDEFLPTILMETIYTLIGNWISVVFFLISLSLFIIIYMRRLVGDKLAALYAAVYIYELAYGAVSVILLFLFAFSLKCYSNYCYQRTKTET